MDNNIAAITSYDGTSNIMISRNADITQDSLAFDAVTKLDNGMQLLSLAWSGNMLLVDGVYHQGRQIYKVDPDMGKLELISSGRWENRDQIITTDGMIYVSDKSGINNLVYQKDGKQNCQNHCWRGYRRSNSCYCGYRFSYYQRQWKITAQ